MRAENEGEKILPTAELSDRSAKRADSFRFPGLTAERLGTVFSRLPKDRMNKMKTIFVKPATMEKKWYIIDAEGKNLGRVAVAAARILRGKNKPEYVPHQDMGDYVIIINAAKANVTGNKVEDKMYYRHSMFPGGLKAENYGKVIVRNPTYPMEHAVKGMLPSGKLGERLFVNLHVYAGSEHPHMAQKPEKVEL